MDANILQKIQISHGISILFSCALSGDIIQQESDQNFKALSAVSDFQTELSEEIRSAILDVMDDRMKLFQELEKWIDDPEKLKPGPGNKHFLANIGNRIVRDLQ
ncbi:MAG: hypothetical protein PHD25_05425 [Bacteroidales bacterium]|nr:hypothetical protein [Bacteroidales bacterium]